MCGLCDRREPHCREAREQDYGDAGDLHLPPLLLLLMLGILTPCLDHGCCTVCFAKIGTIDRCSCSSPSEQPGNPYCQLVPELETFPAQTEIPLNPKWTVINTQPRTSSRPHKHEQVPFVRVQHPQGFVRVCHAPEGFPAIRWLRTKTSTSATGQDVVGYRHDRDYGMCSSTGPPTGFQAHQWLAIRPAMEQRQRAT